MSNCFVLSVTVCKGWRRATLFQESKSFAIACSGDFTAAKISTSSAVPATFSHVWLYLAQIAFVIVQKYVKIFLILCSHFFCIFLCTTAACCRWSTGTSAILQWSMRS